MKRILEETESQQEGKWKQTGDIYNQENVLELSGTHEEEMRASECDTH